MQQSKRKLSVISLIRVSRPSRELVRRIHSFEGSWMSHMSMSQTNKADSDIHVAC